MTDGDSMVGRTIAHYDILSRVGGGGMGVVYRARDTRLGRTVALKFLPPQWSHDENAKLRFVREAQAASATNHPSICTVHDIETAGDGQLFIVMAYYEGLTLKQRIEAGALPIDEALDVATQIADGLARAHAQGVVHRDLKPSNVILTEDGARILDFGLATFADALKLTLEHSTLGTLAYMSPEQVRGESVDARADVWAVGVILYEMLAGHVPFQGSHAEAIAYAVRHETPAALRVVRGEVGEEIEQLVFRAMHKEKAVRFETGRELARALRQVRGHSLPLDLRTEPVAVPRPAPPAQDEARSPRTRRLMLGAAIVALLAGGATYIAIAPVARVPIVIAPVANQTGDEDLEQYRLALTQTLTLSLRDSRDLAVVPYGRVAEIVRRFQAPGSDPSDREALAALEAGTGSALVIVPTLLRKDGEWRARVELRDRETAVSAWTFETEPQTSSLNRDTAFRLALSVAEPIEAHLRSRRSQLTAWVAGIVGVGRRSFEVPFGSLEAAKAFEDGTSSYEVLEYGSARRAMALAAEKAPRDPLSRAWLSRVLMLMREDNAAIEAGDRAEGLLTSDSSSVDRLFVQAVAAEARREFESAEQHYRALVAERPGEALWEIELGGFLDRRLRTSEAVAVYHAALQTDPQLLRPHLELCRMYSPSRLNEPTEARREGEVALAGYRRSGARGGEGHSLLCRADTLRVGSDADRAEARRLAENARDLFEGMGFIYNVARAEYYLALVAGMQGHAAESVQLGQHALTRARDGGNVVIQPLILLNLGSAQVNQGDSQGAADSYRQAYEIYQEWREETRAAQIQANRGAMLIDYGNPNEGMLDLRNAIAVFRKYNDRDYEVFCLRAMATYYNNQGRHADAVNELSQARAIATQWKLTDKVTQVTTHMAVSRFEMNDYAAALQLQVEALEGGTGVRDTETRIRLARTRVRLGDFDSADADLQQAELALKTTPSSVLQPLLFLVRGEWAYESGRTSDARGYFASGSALWGGQGLPEATAVESRAYLGLLDALDGRVASGKAAIATSLMAAERLGLIELAARCRLLLAQVEITSRRFDAADAALAAIPADGDGRALGSELRAAVRYWQGRIQSDRGDQARADSERAAARALLERIEESLPEAFRRSFASRVTIRQMSG